MEKLKSGVVLTEGEVLDKEELCKLFSIPCSYFSVCRFW